MPHRNLPVYSIGAVQRMLDIPAATLRNWEERYGLVGPSEAPAATVSTRATRSSSSVSSRSESTQGLQPAEAHRLLGERLEPTAAVGLGGRTEPSRDC